jgi:D-proline reductase (dithiol) PrdB
MVVLTNLSDHFARVLTDLDCPTFDTKPWVRGGPLSERRVAIVSSAGIHLRSDRHFVGGDTGYRAIPNDADAGDIVMTHISPNYDRTGFMQDINTVLPLDRLAELARDGVIGSVASHHYSFMGATDPRGMEDEARELAGRLKADKVDSVLLVPV